MPPDPPSGSRLWRSRAPQLILPLLWHWSVACVEPSRSTQKNCGGNVCVMASLIVFQYPAVINLNFTYIIISDIWMTGFESCGTKYNTTNKGVKTHITKLTRQSARLT